MLSYNDIQEEAHIKLETLRKEARQYRKSGHKSFSLGSVRIFLRRYASHLTRETNPKPFSLRRVLVRLGRQATRRTRSGGPAPMLPSPSANRP